jgi:pimeloyl-ACP methyl ester carboxylesterase
MRLELISREPSTRRSATPLLFVHGAWHAAWCWDEHFLTHFAQEGFAAHALSLRGHGASEGRERLRWARLADYVADVAQVVDRLGQPPVLVGHSMGGAVVQKYLETHVAPAGVLVASMPPAGVLAATLRLVRRHPILVARANLRLDMSAVVSAPDLVREVLFSSSLPEEEVRTYADRLERESYLAFLDMLGLDLPRPTRVTTPLLVLGAARDALFRVSDVEATAQAYRTDPVIFPDMGHDMMLDAGWKGVADRIVAWLGERRL